MNADGLVAKVRSFADLGANWDADGAEPLDPAIIESASALAAVLAHLAQAVPGSDGSIAFEWHNGDTDVVIGVEPDGWVSLYLRAGDKEWETAAYARSALRVPV